MCTQILDKINKYNLVWLTIFFFLNPEGQGEALPASDRETCPKGCEGFVTQAVVATSARDMTVVEVIVDHPP